MFLQPRTAILTDHGIDPYVKEVEVPGKNDAAGRPCRVQAAGWRLWVMDNPYGGLVKWAAELDQRTFGQQTSFPRRRLQRRTHGDDPCDMHGETLR